MLLCLLIYIGRLDVTHVELVIVVSLLNVPYVVAHVCRQRKWSLGNETPKVSFLH
jgi:hypothetical protein